MPSPDDDIAARLTRERDEARAAAQRAEAQVAAALHARDAMLAKLNHDLRNPLGAIAAATEVLARIGGQQPDEVRAREVIKRQIGNVTRTVEAMVDLNRMLGGAVTLSRAPLDLAEAVRRAIDAAGTAARLDPRRVDASLQPTWIDADASRLDQALLHLLVNAARASLENGRITVLVSPSGSSAQLVVADEGAGIDAARLARIFEPFARDTAGAQPGRGGLGVGLAVVKRIVDAHGGAVTAESAGLGRGARFTVRLPRIEPPRAG